MSHRCYVLLANVCRTRVSYDFSTGRQKSERSAKWRARRKRLRNLLSQLRYFCVGQGLWIGDRLDGGNLSIAKGKVQ
jgi:hypothetical protein